LSKYEVRDSVHLLNKAFKTLKIISFYVHIAMKKCRLENIFPISTNRLFTICLDLAC